MTIKIEKVTLAKDKMDIIGENEGRPIYNGCNYFKGELHIAVRNGVINAKQELDIENINKNLQKKLYDVLNEIEHELNGENINNKYSSNSGSISGGAIGNGTVVNIHSKESILNKEDTEKLLDMGYNKEDINGIKMEIDKVNRKLWFKFKDRIVGHILLD